jgi:hypothetical protein
VVFGLFVPLPVDSAASASRSLPFVGAELAVTPKLPKSEEGYATSPSVSHYLLP